MARMLEAAMRRAASVVSSCGSVRTRCASGRWLAPVIETLPVHHMHEFVALGHAAVGMRLSARPVDDVTPARQLLVEILQTARIGVRCGTDEAREERFACDTRQLQRALLLFGQSLQLCFNHIAQIVPHFEYDLLYWHLQLPLAVRTGDEVALRHVLQSGEHEKRIAFRVAE